MSTVPERLATLENEVKNQGERIEYFGSLLVQVHEHVLKDKGAKEFSRQSGKQRYLAIAGISAFVSALVAVVNRLLPHPGAIF